MIQKIVGRVRINAPISKKAQTMMLVDCETDVSVQETPSTISTYISGSAEEMQKSLQSARRFCRQMVTHSPMNRAPHLWIIPGRDRTLVSLCQVDDVGSKKYVSFWMDDASFMNVNLGDLFRIPFLTQPGFNSSGILDVPHQNVWVSINLIDLLERTGEGKGLLIEVRHPEQILDAKAFAAFSEYSLFQRIFYALAVLPVKTRRKIGVSTDVLYEDRIFVETPEVRYVIVPRKPGEFLLFNRRTLCPEKLPKPLQWFGWCIGRIFEKMHLARFKREKPRHWEGGKTGSFSRPKRLNEVFGSADTKIFIHYGPIMESLRSRFEKKFLIIPPEEVF